MDEMNNYCELNNSKNKFILDNLILNAPTDDIKHLIQGYEIGRSGREIHRHIYKMKKYVLTITANYLGVKSVSNNKTLLTRAIINEIENFMMQKCGQCKSYYNVEKGSQPLLSCYICGQGCHNQCYAEVLKLLEGLAGIRYICGTCEAIESNKYDIEENRTEENKIEETIHVEIEENIDVCGTCEGIESNKYDIEENRTEENTIEETTDVEIEENIDELNMNMQENERLDSKELRSPRKDINKKNVIPKICQRYNYGICPNYGTCQYEHPRRCRNLLDHGRCSYGNKCKFHHPKMCYRSVSERMCLNLNCRFFHIKGTKRYEQVNQQQPKSTGTNLNPIWTEEFENTNVYNTSATVKQIPHIINEVIDQNTMVHNVNQQSRNRSYSEVLKTSPDTPFLGEMNTRMEKLEIMISNIMASIQSQVNQQYYTTNIESQPQVQENNVYPMIYQPHQIQQI